MSLPLGVEPRAATVTTTLTCVLVLLVACGDPEADPTALDEMEPPASDACPAETPAFSTGMFGLTASNQELGVKARVVEADYVPPRFGINSWVVAITDLADQPLPQATLTWACAFMPAHGHGSNPATVEKLDATRWKLERQNMSMQGGWEIWLWIDPTGAGAGFTGAKGGINSNSCRGPNGATQTLALRTCVPRKA